MYLLPKSEKTNRSTKAKATLLDLILDKKRNSNRQGGREVSHWPAQDGRKVLQQKGKKTKQKCKAWNAMLAGSALRSVQWLTSPQVDTA